MGFVICFCVFSWVLLCAVVCMCGFNNLSFVMCRYVCMCGFCNVLLCVFVGFLMFCCVYVWVCNVWVCVCVGFVMCGCVYVWVL